MGRLNQNVECVAIKKERKEKNKTVLIRGQFVSSIRQGRRERAGTTLTPCRSICSFSYFKEEKRVSFCVSLEIQQNNVSVPMLMIVSARDRERKTVKLPWAMKPTQCPCLCQWLIKTSAWSVLAGELFSIRGAHILCRRNSVCSDVRQLCGI